MIDLPYSGTVTIDITVKKGNGIDIFLTNEYPNITYKKNKYQKLILKDNLKRIQPFEAHNAKIYRRSGPLAAGKYYIVVRDATGFLGPAIGWWTSSSERIPQSSSDIQILAKLEP